MRGASFARPALSRALLLALSLAACGGAPPATRFYQPVAFSAGVAEPSEAAPVLVIEPLAADAAYTTDRIVYRKSPYRLDYYNYHRWSAAPAIVLEEYLRRAYARTGLFARVESAPATIASAILTGRVLALEEVDESETRWLGRVALELTLRDPRDGTVLWSRTFDEREPLTEQTPEGLARAVSAALERVVTQSAGPLAQIAGGSRER